MAAFLALALPCPKAEAATMEADKRSHYLLTLEMSTFGYAAFKSAGLSRPTSVLLTGSLVFMTATAKELWLDPAYSPQDQWANLGGIATSLVLGYLVTEDRRRGQAKKMPRWTFATTLGAGYHLQYDRSADEQVDAARVELSTTLWYRRTAGLSISVSSGVGIHPGHNQAVGARFRIVDLHAKHSKIIRTLSLWTGVEYAYVSFLQDLPRAFDRNEEWLIRGQGGIDWGLGRGPLFIQMAATGFVFSGQFFLSPSFAFGLEF